MKFLFLLFLFTSSAWTKSLVLVSYFDAFNKAPFNNSERVAKALAGLFEKNDTVEIKLCKIQTIFDKAYAQLEICLKELPEAPAMVLGLGEVGCDLKVELMVRNLDKNSDPDNEGHIRKNTVIIPEAPKTLGLHYPLPQMYCSLTKDERDDVVVSNDAGSFVCNNTAFLMSYHYPEVSFGFVHVPSHSCYNLARKTQRAVEKLQTMITAGVAFLETEFVVSPETPHSSNQTRLPIKKEDILALRARYDKKNPCLFEFFKRARPEEATGFWSFLN